MAELVSMDWVARFLGQPGHIVVDARRPMKYLAGHLPGAINVPAYKGFGPGGRLLDARSLAELIGNAGVGDNCTIVVYDSPEGQNAAMLAWILEYLGRGDIRILESFFEGWKASGREILYKPVVLPSSTFTVRLNPSVRATLDDIRDTDNIVRVDFRSREEFNGTTTLGDDRPGHIPGALNIVWRELGIPTQRVLKPAEDLARLMERTGVIPDGNIIAYCRSGPRAALGYLALNQMGAKVRLFDGSFAEWSQAGLPTEKCSLP